MNEIPPVRLYIKILLILLSCGLLIISFYDRFSIISWLCLAPYFVVLSFSTLGQSVLFSWVTGLLFFAGVTSWFTEYSFIYWLPIIGLLSLYFLFYGIVFYFINSKVEWPSLRILLISSVWIAGEYLRHRTFLAFPWGVLGYAQHGLLPLMQTTKITGILGISLFIILANLAISEILRKYILDRVIKSTVKTPLLKTEAPGAVKSGPGGKIRRSVFVVVIATIILVSLISGFVYMQVFDSDYKGNKINIALVQTNISFDDKYQDDTRVLIPDPYSKKYYFREDTDLVVFPESVIWGPIGRERNKSFKDWVDSTAKGENLYFLVGQIIWDEERNYYNVVQLYDPSLKIMGRYKKIHPLPCGEYMPYPDILGFLSFLNIAKLNITPSKEVNTINYPGKGDVGTNICFESTIPLISRMFRSKGSGLLFTLTDDAGFRDSIASWHHLIFSRARAIENGSFMVHIGNNGISAIIDPMGIIKVKSELLKKEVIYGTAYFIGTRTFYTRYGELIMFIYWGISLFFLVYYLLRRKIYKALKKFSETSR